MPVSLIDRVGVAVVVLVADLDPRQGAEQAPADLVAVVPGRPRIDDHAVELGEAPKAERVLHLGAGLDDLLAREELLEHDLGLDAGDVIPALDPGFRQETSAS